MNHPISNSDQEGGSNAGTDDPIKEGRSLGDHKDETSSSEGPATPKEQP